MEQTIARDYGLRSTASNHRRVDGVVRQFQGHPMEARRVRMPSRHLSWSSSNLCRTPPRLPESFRVCIVCPFLQARTARDLSAATSPPLSANQATCTTVIHALTRVPTGFINPSRFRLLGFLYHFSLPGHVYRLAGPYDVCQLIHPLLGAEPCGSLSLCRANH